MLLSLLQQLLLGFLKLFLLSLSHLNRLAANDHLFFHRIKLLDQLLLLALRFFLFLLFLHELLNQLLFLFLFEVSLVLNFFTFTLSLEPHLLFFFSKLLLELQHFFCVNLDDLLLLNDLVIDNTVFFHNQLWVDTVVESVKLFLEFSNFLLVLTKESVFGVLVDTWFVLDVFCATRIPKRIHGLIVVIICWTYVCDHDRLSIASKRVLKKSGKLAVTVRDVS